MQSCELLNHETISLAFSTPTSWTCIATHRQNPPKSRTNPTSPKAKGERFRVINRTHVRTTRSIVPFINNPTQFNPQEIKKDESDVETVIDITNADNENEVDNQMVTLLTLKSSPATRTKRKTTKNKERTKYVKGREKQTDTVQLKAAISSDVVTKSDEAKTSKSDTVNADINSRKDGQKTFLAEQLEKRKIENEQKKVKTAKKEQKTKTKKRVRPISASGRASARSQALKDTFQAYMEEISRDELLDQSAVISLAEQIKEGLTVEITQRTMQEKLGRRPSIPEIAEKIGIDVREVQKRRMTGTAAKNTLVAANLRLVTSVARKVATSKGINLVGIAIDDLVQEGSVGLLRAAEKFDASRGYMFSTYATWWIRAYVMRSITTQSRSIKVPSTIVDEYSRIKKEHARIRELGDFQPSDEAVASNLGITVAKLRFVVNVVTRVPTSLDTPLGVNVGGTNSRSLGEIIEGDDKIEETLVKNLEKKELDLALRNRLRPLERAVIKLRFGLEDGQPRTLRETGDLLGLSKERIRQVIFRALPKLKTPEIQKMLEEATAR